MTELLFWIGACGLALSIGAPLVYLALFDPCPTRHHTTARHRLVLQYLQKEGHPCP